MKKCSCSHLELPSLNPTERQSVVTYKSTKTEAVSKNKLPHLHKENTENSNVKSYMQIKEIKEQCYIKRERDLRAAHLLVTRS